MEQSKSPEGMPPGFTELYHAFSEFLIRHGDFDDSWNSAQDGALTLGLPRGGDTKFELRQAKNELQDNPHGFYNIWTEFTPAHRSEMGEPRPATLFAQVYVTDELSQTFFLKIDAGIVHAIVDTADAAGASKTTRKDGQLTDDDVELLRQVYETVQANLA